MIEPYESDDPHDRRYALGLTGLLGRFNAGGVLEAADVHAARRIQALATEPDDEVALALALAVRAVRHGSVCLDLPSLAEEPLPDGLAWPASGWSDRVADSRIAQAGVVRVEGGVVYLDRYWREECQVRDDLVARLALPPPTVDEARLATLAPVLFPSGYDEQGAAALAAARRWTTVLTGGPGTGKTTAVAGLLALLADQSDRPLRIALSAPTGKAAARLQEAVRTALGSATFAGHAEAVGEPVAQTLHRLLGWRRGSRNRFRHDRRNRLPHDVIVVDETSMVSLTMMARLVEAVRTDCRLVFVGDPDQLASVEAGAVLGDLVGAEPRVTVATLSTNRRFPATSGIALLAAAVQDGRGGDALDVLRSGSPEVELVEVDDDAVPTVEALDGVHDDVVASGTALAAAAESGDARGALAALDAHRLLCAHRRGPRGVAHWSALAARWVADAHPVVPREDGRYAGEPLLVTANDYEIGLYNGDTGVVVDDGHGGLVAAFGRGGAPIDVPLVRLGAVRPLHAMTVHRSQGSQFGRITVVLPPAGSPLGTRETLYTAVTRATSHVRVIGSAEALVAAVARPAARATGLRERLTGTL